jgi:glycosylphosphatidylinositol transamidase (GPIT) subunit GPI8
MMDELDLEKPDPKRHGLENDRIVLEYVKNAFQTNLDLYPTRVENDQDRAMKEPEAYKKNILEYQIAQKNYLAQLIETYQNQLNKLNKDDVL